MRNLIALNHAAQKEQAIQDWYALVHSIQAAGFTSIPARWKILSTNSTAQIDAKIAGLRTWFNQQCPLAGENE